MTAGTTPTWCRCTWAQMLLVQRQVLNSLIPSPWGRLWPPSQPGCAVGMSSWGLPLAPWPRTLGLRAPGPQRSYPEHNASEGRKTAKVLNTFSASFLYHDWTYCIFHILKKTASERCIKVQEIQRELSHPRLKVRFVTHLGQWGRRRVVLLVNCDWCSAGGKRRRWYWGSCCLHHAVCDDLLDSINCAWRTTTRTNRPVWITCEDYNVWLTKKLISGTDGQQALWSVLGHVDREADPCRKRAERMWNYEC